MTVSVQLLFSIERNEFMLFKEIGNQNSPTIILLHGGGLSWWSLQSVIDKLKDNYHVITPIIDGHGEDGVETFVNIEDSAEKLINYIDTKCVGHVYAICGLSLGAQIVTEVLSRRDNITQFAIIESALVYPIKGTTALTVPSFQLFYGLIKQRWFSKMQAKTLAVPEHMFETYYKDSLQMSKESLINLTLSNGNYELKNTIANTLTKVLIIVGEKELGVMKKSAKRLHETIKNSELFLAPQMKHGEISLIHPDLFIKTLQVFFAKQ